MTNLTREILRKFVHLFQLVIIAGYSLLNFYFSQRIALLGLTGLLLILLEIEYFRVDYRTRIGSRITEFFSKLILRKHERNNVVSAVFFVISSIISFSVFDYSIALLALFFTVFGDLTAAIMGNLFGGKKIFRNKTYVGTISEFIVNSVIALLILPEYAMITLPMAFVATLVETLTQKLDDNLTTPLFSGFTGQVLLFLTKISL